jgi:hypothetical protein
MALISKVQLQIEYISVLVSLLRDDVEQLTSADIIFQDVNLYEILKGNKSKPALGIKLELLRR